MEKISAILIVIFLCFQISTTKELKIASRKHETSFPMPLLIDLFYESDKLSYAIFVDGHTISTVKGIFTDSSNTFNCTFEYKPTGFFSPLIYFSSIRRGNEYFSGIREFDRGSYQMRWKILLIDLYSCNYSISKFTVFTDHLNLDRTSNDIFIINSTLCGNKVCRMSLDSQLNNLTGPEAWIDGFGNYIDKIELKSPALTDKRYLIVQRLMGPIDRSTNISIEKISFQTENGTRILRQLTNPNSSYSEISQAPNVITLLNTKNEFSSTRPILNILQFDFDGHLKFQLERNYNQTVFVTSVKSLADGGFLLIIGRGLKEKPDFEKPKCLFFVTKYDASGKAVSEIVFKEFQYPLATHSNRVRLFEIREKFYCLVQPQLKLSEECKMSGCTTIFEQCFREEEMEPIE